MRDAMALLGPSKDVTLKVTGMTCGNCVKHVTDALQGVPGVKKAVVDLDAARADVSFDPEKADTQDLVSAVEEAGYEAQA